MDNIVKEMSDIGNDVLIDLQETIMHSSKSECETHNINEDIVDSLMKYKLTNELYITIRAGVKKGLFNLDHLLLSSCEVSLMEDDDWIQIVYLAISNGANVNMYVDVGEDVNYHILYYLDQLCLSNIENREESTEQEVPDEFIAGQEMIKNTICSMLIMYGSNPKMEVTDIQRSERESMSEVQLLLKNPDGSNSILTAIKNNYKEFSNEYGRITYKLFRLLHKKKKKSLGDVVTRKLLSKYYATYIGILLDSPEILAQMEMLDDIDTVEKCIALVSNRCVEESIKLVIDNSKLRKGGNVFKSEEDKEIVKNLFYSAILTYNVDIIEFMLSLGIEPSYLVLEEMLLLMYRMKDSSPLSTAIHGSMLVKMVNHGYGLDTYQLKYLSTVSINIHKRVKELYDIPYWKKACRVKTNKPNKYLKILAKKLGFDPSSSKKELCKGMSYIASMSIEEVLSLHQEEMEMKVNASVLDLATIIKRKKKGKDRYRISDCVNKEALKRPMSEYSKHEIIHIVDDGKLYCFSIEDFKDLIKSGYNPYTKNEFKETTINDMIAKLDAYNILGVPTTSDSIREGLKLLNEKDSTENYDYLAKERVSKFLDIMKDQNINPEYFVYDLNIQDLQNILYNIQDEENVFILDKDNKTHALRLFSIIMIEEFKYMDNERIEDVITLVKNYIDDNFDVVEE